MEYLDTVAKIVTWIVNRPQEFGIWILLVHPVWLTVLLALLTVWFITRLRLWHRQRRIIVMLLLGACALYAIDAAIALPRILYARQIPDHAAIHQTVGLPASLVLVNAICDDECHSRLLAGELEEVILVETPWRDRTPRPPRRYRVGWTRPGTCPQERKDAISGAARRLIRDGFCPLVESVEIPTEGIFVVNESFVLRADEKAIRFTPTYLTDAPPAKTIELKAVEVQRRTRAGIEVIAARRYYEAPGLIGLPPLVGCWERPDNIVWIMPAGDTGCGFWRWFTWGGDTHWDGGVAWVYTGVFTPTARPVIPPRRPEFPPADPTEAIKILSRVSSIEDYLPALKDSLLSSSLSDQPLIELILQRAQRNTLEGALVGVLSQKSPKSAAAIAARLGEIPKFIKQPGVIITSMGHEPLIFDAWANFMFEAMAYNWPRVIGPVDEGDPEVEHLLALLHDRDPAFVCDRLDRVTRPGGILDTRDIEGSKNYFEMADGGMVEDPSTHPLPVNPLPSFLPPLVRAAPAQCGKQANGFMQTLMQAPAPARREQVAWLISSLPEGVAADLADQAFANLLDDRGMEHWAYNNDPGGQYLRAHLAILVRAGQSCDVVERKLKSVISELHQQGRTPSPRIREWLAYLHDETSRPIQCERAVKTGQTRSLTPP